MLLCLCSRSGPSGDCGSDFHERVVCGISRRGDRKEKAAFIWKNARKRLCSHLSLDEYWKGSPGREVVIYGMANVSSGRCEGWGDVSVGKEYLIYAFERNVQAEYSRSDRTWIEYVDAIPKGTKIMTLGACTPSGEIAGSDVDLALRKLGPGTRVKQSN
jgi:hypothetical protein